MIKRYVFYLFLLPVLFSGFSQGLWALDSGAAVNEGNSGNGLNRLIGISTQLSVLNERLRNELQDSRQNSRELLNMLEASKQELEELRSELGVLQNSSTELLIKAEYSQTELTGLQEALRKAEYSLMSLELSWAAYRESAERSINILSRKKTFWKWSCIAAGVLAAGFGTAFVAGR